MPVTIPSGVTVAIFVLDDTQVPPAAGAKVVVFPTQMDAGPLMEAKGLPLIITCSLGSDEQPRLVVKTNLAVPLLSPVTIPALVTDAIDGLRLIQLPPVVGESVVVVP